MAQLKYFQHTRLYSVRVRLLAAREGPINWFCAYAFRKCTIRNNWRGACALPDVLIGSVIGWLSKELRALINSINFVGGLIPPGVIFLVIYQHHLIQRKVYTCLINTSRYLFWTSISDAHWTFSQENYLVKGQVFVLEIMIYNILNITERIWINLSMI